MPRRRRERFVPNVRARLVDAGILQHTTPTRRSNPSLLALGGPDHRTSAASLASLFDRVFALDPKRAREYCVEEPDWASAVEFWDYRDRQGDGWAILTDAWRGDASAEDILARLEAIETPYD